MSSTPLYPNSGSARGLQSVIWGNSVQAYESNDPKFGTRIKLRPASLSPLGLTGTTSATHEGGWTAQDAVTAGGTYSVTDAAQAGGQLLVANNGTNADEGVEFGSSLTALTTPQHSTAPSQKLIFQARFDAVAVNGQQFYGLTDALAATPVVGANDALADVGYIGFQVDEDGDLNFVSKSANGGTSDSVEVIENADFVQLDPHVVGFSIDKNGKLEIEVDNVRYPSKASEISTSSYPTGVLRVATGATSSGTTAASYRLGDIDAFAESAG